MLIKDMATATASKYDAFGCSDTNIICLCTCMNSGTHYVRTWLETSDDIDWCVHEYTEKSERLRLHLSLLEMQAGISGKPAFQRRLLATRADNSDRLSTTRPALHEALYGHQPEKVINDVKYRLFAIHPTWATADILFTLPFYCFISAIRHPALVLCSMIRRFRGVKRDLHITILEYIRMQLILFDRSVYNVVVNPWVNGTSCGSSLFDYINATESDATRAFLRTNPIINSTDSHADKDCETVRPIVGPLDEDFRNARDYFIATGEIHSKLKPYYSYVERSGLLDQYRDVCSKEGIEAEPC